MATCISFMFRTLQPGFEAATTSRWQKCPPRAPGGPTGESRALRPAPRATAGPAAPAGVQLGREGDKRGPGGAPRPPGRLNLEDMAALWCPGQGPVVRCRCGPALPSYAARRTASKGTVANFALPSQISPVRAPVWSVTVALPNGKHASTRTRETAVWGLQSAQLCTHAEVWRA